MKPLALVLLSLALITLPPGCVRSLHPIYTDDTLAYDPVFLGSWQSADGKNRVDISPAEDSGAGRAYRVLYTDEDGKSAALKGHLAKVGDMLVGDLAVAGEGELPDSDVYKSHLAPLHTFWVVKCDGKTLAYRTINRDWLNALIEKDPAAIAHVKIDDEYVLTAPPGDLQKFLLAHAKEMLSDEETLQRVEKPLAGGPAAAKTQPTPRETAP